MRTIYALATALLLVLGVSSCTKNFERYNQDPYGATPEEMTRIPTGATELNNLIRWVVPNQENGYQMSFSLMAGYISGYSGGTAHGGDFPSYTPRADWVAYPMDDTFSNHLYNHFRPLAARSGSDYNYPYYALGQVLRIAITHWVSDMYGPVPFSKVTGISLQVPYDTQQELYMNMLKELKLASQALDQVPLGYDAYKEYDNVYQGNMRHWARYARSLMLRMAVRISGVAPTQAQEYAEWAIANGVIEENSQNAINPSSDNPLFKIEQTWKEARAGADIVGYLMAYADPRLPKMIRQGTQGYVGFRSTTITMGDAERASYAVTNIDQNSPMPWLTASEVVFLKAEAALLGWNVGGQSAKELYEQGIRLSFEQWGAEGVDQYLQVTDTRGGYNNPIHPEYSLPTFKSNVTVNWDSAAGNVEQQKAMIATQKWIALFPYNTVEAWAEWRRTGYPNLLPAVSNLSGGAVEDIHQVNGRDCGGLRRLTFPQQEKEQNAAGVAIGIADLGGPDALSTDLWWAK